MNKVRRPRPARCNGCLERSLQRPCRGCPLPRPRSARPCAQPPLRLRRSCCGHCSRRAARCAAADPVKGKTIGFINAGPDDYYAQFGKTLKAVAETYGMNVVEVNSDYKPEKELANVQDLAAKGVDAIAVITAGAAGSAASIKAANDAKVPIFFIAGKPELQPGTDLTGHVTDNFVILGYQLGQWVAKNYPNAKCVEIPGFLGQGPAEGQIVGFQMALDEAKLGRVQGAEERANGRATKPSRSRRTSSLPARRLT